MRPLIPTKTPGAVDIPSGPPERWWFYEEDVWSNHAFWKLAVEENDQEMAEWCLEEWRHSEVYLRRLIDVGYKRIIREEELYDERDYLHLYEREE